ncbi:formate hydrogenlyase maturation HycH family protein [Vibrio mangrovi]|uniref:Formate hydrogenlyase maturation HycH family protein n=1 Tax=Vibrio mangrovi TaxID=474394 RepID=A0A1Y6J275_9VIBR|nr:formate hydrogenlyase maturation HycH family protein [Vibrio mangrovi]MDW6002030.1 formate hydrogenlyase maturation HycH family protein [Vibrio mangrovi]SMS02423.1 Formate hydrogenlyase maturation protein HycH [Vibrio mangrovi]
MDVVDIQSEKTSKHLNDQVRFYRLTRKFVDEQDMPQEARQIMYYSLAIGHHLGIVDCLQSDMDCNGEEYLAWIQGLPKESEAYRKMKGFLTFGEITIFPEHIHMLASAFKQIDIETQSEKSSRLTEGLIDILGAIHREPNMYLMIRGTVQ